MKIGIVGSGRIGSGAARMFARAGHEVMLSGSRDPASYDSLAEELGGEVGTPAEAVAFGDVFVFAVPWRTVDDVVPTLGPLDGKIVIDTTNQFGAGGVEDLVGRTAAQVNAQRLDGARYTKSFNTLTSGFQAEASARTGADKVALFLCGDDAEAKQVVSGLIADAGFVPVDGGGTAGAAPMEAPRRDGAVYGEEYREPDAREAGEAMREGRPVPPPPQY
ncbi:MAG TPA: NAD(P)-binding domain-containing protein [Solirubrobacteraceae bacterium]|nr:NAD(P)-binding domain-containing protein [Solirubrobacteraceae bacterium]